MIAELFNWLGQEANAKPLALIIFFSVYVAIVAYVYTGKKRKSRLESYKDIPFMDDELHDSSSKKQG